MKSLSYFSRRAMCAVAAFAAVLLIAACSGGSSSSSGGGGGSFGKASISGNVNTGVAYYHQGSNSLIAMTIEFAIPNAYADGVGGATVCLHGTSGTCVETDTDGDFRFDNLDPMSYDIYVNGAMVTTVTVNGSSFEREVRTPSGLVIEIEVEGPSISGEVEEDSEDSDSDSDSEDSESEDDVGS